MQVEIATARATPSKIREQSGCIPYRDVDGVRQVLLVKKKTKQAWWGFTKGGLEKTETKKSNAAKECFEEAGVTGTVTNKIGKFEYVKDNARQIVHMFAMIFGDEAPDWLEKKTRKRKWFTLNEARDKLSREHHKFLDAIRAQPAITDTKLAKRKRA